MKSGPRLYVDMTDILALRLECVKCGAAVSVKPSELTVRLSQCPNCLENWSQNSTEGLDAVLNFLRETNAPVDDHVSDLYKLQFEIAAPDV